MMKIYGVPLSVHTRKVIVAAKLKGIPFDLSPVVPVIPGNPPPDWREISPTGLVPAIDDDGFRLADSTAITLYLERRQPQPALLPKDDQAYGAALALDAWVGGSLFRDVIHPIFHNQVVNPNINKTACDDEAVRAAKGRAAEAFAYLESLAPESFLVAGQLTIADLAVISNLVMFAYLGGRIDAARQPKLKAYFEHHIASPLLAGVLAEEAPYADRMGLDRSFIS